MHDRDAASDGAQTTGETSLGRLHCIDFLRGCAALAVVVYHAVITLDAAAPGYRHIVAPLREGRAAVPLFFVISGFCIHHAWARQCAAGTPPRFDFVAFWKRRLRRLYPPYAVALCLSMALVAGALLWAPLRAFVKLPHLYEPTWSALGVDFAAHLAMLHGVHAKWDYGGGNEAFWTLAREEYFYLLYFPLLWWHRSRGLAVAVLTVLVLSFLIPFLAGRVQRVWHYDLSWNHALDFSTSAIGLWMQWVLGMVAVEAYCGTTKLPSWCHRWWVFAFCLSITFVNRNYGVWQLTALFTGISFFVLVNACVNLERLGRWPRRGIVKVLTKIGIFSYSLYLVHYPLIRALGGVERQVREGFGLEMSPLYYLAAFTLMVTSACIAGLVFFHAIERHFLNTPAVNRSVP